MNDHIINPHPFWDDEGPDDEPMMQLDVLIFEGETEEEVMGLLHRRFGVNVKRNPIQYNISTTMLFMGAQEKLDLVKHWHAARRTEEHGQGR